VVFGPIIARKFNKPYIITPHGTLYRETFYKKSKWFKLLHYYSLVKSNLEKANCIHFTTEDERQKINDWLGLELRFKVIPYGIEEVFPNSSTENFRKKFKIPKGKKIILFIGRINWKKGIDLLFKTFEKLSKKHKNLLLVCAGPDPENYFSQLDQLVSSDTQKSIIKTGMLNNIDKLNAYNIADLFVLPSYSENFGMTVIEAARQKVPIVISDQVGIYNEFQNNNAALISSCNKEQLHDAINELLTKPKKADKLKQNAYNLFKQNFTQDIIANKFTNMYMECLEN
jgi:glycosyltransferase involved in cell wall biosynthesis